MMKRRQLLLGASGALLGGNALAQTAAPAALDSARILVGFVPGGLSDVIARRLADRLRGGYAGSVIVDNRPGASGQIALSALKDAPADGSVLGLTHSSALAMYPFTFKKLPYDPQKDFQPVSLVCHTNHALCVGPAVPASVKTVKEFLAWCKEHPDKSNYGSPGVGSMPHLIMTVVNYTAKSDVQLVAYKGTAAAITDLLGGQISAASGPLGNFLPQVRAGKLRLIATSGDSRSGQAPDIATYREQGFPLTAREWYGLYLPAKATRAAVERASAQAQAAVGDAGVHDALQQAGVDVASSTPATLASMLEADTLEWRRLTREIGFTAES